MLSLTPPTSIFFTSSLWLTWFRSYSLLPQVAETHVYTHTHTHKRVRTHRLNPFTCVCVEEVCMDQDGAGSEEEEFTSQLYNTLKTHLGR